MLNIEKEIENAVDNALLDTLLFYANNYREQREQIFIEFEKQALSLIRQVKKELDELDEL